MWTREALTAMGYVSREQAFDGYFTNALTVRLTLGEIPDPARLYRNGPDMMNGDRPGILWVPAWLDLWDRARGAAEGQRMLLPGALYANPARQTEILALHAVGGLAAVVRALQAWAEQDALP